MRGSAAAALAAVLVACARAEPVAPPPVPLAAARPLDPAPGEMLVTADDVSGRRLEELGWLEWPTPGMMMLFAVPCTPKILRAAALREYGGRASAIVRYVEWREDGRQLHCGGTAVRFAD